MKRKYLISTLFLVFTWNRRTNYKDALKYGFYELQTARDWYREVTNDVGMHADLVQYWIRISALLVLPIAPHFSEHIWSTVLKEPTTVQNAPWPTPSSTPDRTILDAGAYVKTTVKNLRDAELNLVKKMNKGKRTDAAYDPKKSKSVRIFVATSFPDWQNACVQIVKEAYVSEADKVDDAKVRALLTERGLIKDKRAMPFVQAFKVCLFLHFYSRYSNVCAHFPIFFFFFLIETDSPVWCRDCVQPDGSFL